MTLFFDRNTGRRVPRALQLLGLDVQWHDQCGFGPTTPDEQWLSYVGQKKWVVITHDRRFVYNQSEIQAVKDYQVACVVLSGGSVDRWGKVRMLARSWDLIQRIINSESPPYIWRRLPNGQWRRLYP